MFQLLLSHASLAAGVSAGNTGLSTAASAAGASPAGGAPPTPTWLLLELQDRHTHSHMMSQEYELARQSMMRSVIKADVFRKSESSNETCDKIGSPPSPTSQKLLFVVEAVSLSGGNFQFMVLDDFLQSSIQILLLLL